MHYLIDGYNLMHAAGLMRPRFGPGGLEKARRALLGVLAGSLGEDAAHTTVVFDASNDPRPDRTEPDRPAVAASIRVEFAVGEESADARIEKLILIESAPKRLAVVSSDARIRTATKRRGARSIESEKFWDEIVSRRRPRSQSPDRKLPDEAVDRPTRESEFWLREFQDLISEKDLRELAGPFEDLEPS